MNTITEIELHPAFEDMCREIEKRVGKYSLSDAIRDGKRFVNQTHGGWIEGENVCALSAAAMAVKARQR